MIRHTFLLATCVAIAACSSPSDDRDDDNAVTADPAPSSVAPARTDDQPAPQPEVDPNSQEERAVAQAASQDTIPARFHGKWATTAEHCEIRGHQQYRIGAEEVGFFESRGVVQTVRVDGDYAAATLSEQYGDAPPSVYVFYMARESEDAMRLRYDKREPFNVVRCPPE